MTNRKKIQSLIEDLVKAGIRMHFVKIKENQRECLAEGNIRIALDRNMVIISLPSEEHNKYVVAAYHKHVAQLDIKLDGIRIKNRLVAEEFKFYFDILWKISKK